MKEGQKLWTRDELILAVNLYCKLPFGKMHKSNPEIVRLAHIIDRTPSSVALKLGNFASFDPTLQERGIKGASNASKLDKLIWDEFYNNWEDALLESEALMAKKQNTTVEEMNGVDVTAVPLEGKEKMRLVKARVNQNIFRKMVLATYNSKCCITGISVPELLVASHIVPWSKDERNRLNPMNGLCLNALHDKAFDAGLITIDASTYKIRVSSALRTNKSIALLKSLFEINDVEIKLPDKFLPDRQFLSYHNGNLFRQ
jgi:putative restriction endonuclease